MKKLRLGHPPRLSQVVRLHAPPALPPVSCRHYERRFLGFCRESVSQALHSKCPGRPRVPGPLGRRDQAWEPAHPFLLHRDTPSQGSAATSSRFPSSRAHPGGLRLSPGLRPWPPEATCFPPHPVLSHGRCPGTQTQTPEECTLGRESPDEKMPEVSARGRKSRQLPGSQGWARGPDPGQARVRCPAAFGEVAAEPGQSACLWLASLSAPPGCQASEARHCEAEGAGGVRGWEGSEGDSPCGGRGRKPSPRLRPAQEM